MKRWKAGSWDTKKHLFCSACLLVPFPCDVPLWQKKLLFLLSCSREMWSQKYWLLTILIVVFIIFSKCDIGLFWFSYISVTLPVWRFKITIPPQYLRRPTTICYVPILWYNVSTRGEWRRALRQRWRRAFNRASCCFVNAAQSAERVSLS